MPTRLHENGAMGYYISLTGGYELELCSSFLRSIIVPEVNRNKSSIFSCQKNSNKLIRKGINLSRRLQQ